MEETLDSAVQLFLRKETYSIAITAACLYWNPSRDRGWRLLAVHRREGVADHAAGICARGAGALLGGQALSSVAGIDGAVAQNLYLLPPRSADPALGRGGSWLFGSLEQLDSMQQLETIGQTRNNRAHAMSRDSRVTCAGSTPPASGLCSSL